MVANCTRLIEQRVADNGGVLVRTTFQLLRTAWPDFVPRAVNRLLPEFIRALEPLYQRYRAQDGVQFNEFLTRHSDEAAQALLAVTDKRVEQTGNRMVMGAYGRLRPRAEQQVIAAVPALGQYAEKWLEVS